MNTTKKYRDSLLSALCMISWLVISFRIFTSAIDDEVIKFLPLTCLVTTIVAITGGVILVFAALKKRSLKQHFIYNLFGTINLITGCLGLFFFASDIHPSPYLIVACLGVGILMYKAIYKM